MFRLPTQSTLFPYTTLFRSQSKSKTLKVGQTVTLQNSASRFATGETIASHAKGKRYKIIQVKSDRVLLDSIMSWVRSEEHTSDSSHVAISYAVFCLKQKRDT